MDNFYNWHQMRGLAALAVFGLFIVYACVAGAWQIRKAKREALRMTEQDEPLSIRPSIAHGDEGRAVDARQSWRQDRAAAGSARQAA